MQLDRVAFMTAFERVAERLMKPPYNYAVKGDKYESIPFLRQHKYGELPETLEALFERSLDDEAIANFITLLVVREMSPSTTKVRGEHVLVKTKRGGPSFTFFAGDLVVKGNFAYEHTVLVQGDLIVDGMIEDKFEASPLLVGGNVRAKGMYLGSETRIGGKLDVTDLLHLRFTRGGKTLFVEGDARAKLYVWTPHDSRFMGTLYAKYKCEAYPDRSDPLFVKLRAALAPNLAKKLDVEEPDMTVLAKSVRDGIRIWR